MNDNALATGNQWRCYQCKSGCFHLVWGGTMLTLSSDQFSSMVETVNAVYRQSRSESEISFASSVSDSLVM